VKKLLLDEITDTIEQRYDVDIRFPEKWRRSLCRQSEIMLHSASLIQCAAAPAGYETLRALHGGWAAYCEALGNRVLEFVAELEKDSPFAFPDFELRYVLQALSAAEANQSARSIYLKSLPPVE
jgi:hypothetical protein